MNSLHILYRPEDVPEKILYCYGVYQSLFVQMSEEIPNIKFHEGLPTMEDILTYSEGSHCCVIFDDLAHKFVNSPDMEVVMIRWVL